MEKITCDVQEGDEAWLADLVRDIEQLTGLVHEMFVENRVLLLSPVLRGLIADQGHKVEEKLAKVCGRLHVDNPGKPLSHK